MNIEFSTDNDIVIAAIEGPLDATTQSQAEEALMPYVTPGAHMVVNMAACDFVASAGLRLLLVLGKKFNRPDGGRFCLVHVQANVQDVIDMVGFSDFLSIFDDLAAGIAYIEGE